MKSVKEINSSSESLRQIEFEESVLTKEATEKVEKGKTMTKKRK